MSVFVKHKKILLDNAIAQWIQGCLKTAFDNFHAWFQNSFFTKNKRANKVSIA